MATVRFEHVDQRDPYGFAAVTDFDLEVADGEMLAVVGPVGCGASTTLRMLAGLDDISGGKIWIGDRCVNGVEGRRRNVAMVARHAALYPHLTVAGNLACPLEIAGIDRVERERRVRDIADTLRLTELIHRTPRMLSGPQRRLVTMGRAMVRRPEVLLMDEPLSDLDADGRLEMRATVSELQRELETTMLYVTDDPAEAMAIGDRVAIMHLGVLQQVATPDELTRRPANPFVAGFIGSPTMNRIEIDIRRTADIAALSPDLG